MLKFKKITALTLAAILTASSLVACGKKTEDTKDKKQEEISLMIPEWGQPSQEMLDEFKKETGISVKVLPTAWDDIKKKISVASAGNNAVADVIEVDWSWVGEFQSAGWLEKLDIDEDTIKDIPSLSSYKVGDSYYAVPYANGLRLAYMNKEMMKKAGVGEVAKDWTSLEKTFDKMMETKTVKHPFLFPLAAEEKTTTSFITLAYTRNGILFNKDNTLNRESLLDTFTFLENALKKGYIDPASPSTSGMDTFTGINKANGAFLIGPLFILSSSQDERKSEVIGQVEAIQMPGKNSLAKKDTTFSEAIGVCSYSKNKEAARKFVKWFSSSKAQLELNKAVNNMPTRTSVLEKMIADGSLKNADIMIEESKITSNPFPNGIPKYYAQLSSEIFNTVNELGQKKLTAQEATDKLINNVNKLIEDNK